jgi:hypothetical protein
LHASGCRSRCGSRPAHRSPSRKGCSA